VMPAPLTLLFISIICAAAFFAAVFRRNLQLPAIATVLLVLSSVLIGAAWPQVLQQFSVAPNAQQREALSIERNIKATRDAFGLNNIKEIQYSGQSTATPAEVRAETATMSNIRLLDPAKIERTFTQRQQLRAFYGFPPQLDIDRYEVNGQLQDFVVAVRELDTSGLSGNQTEWINQHLVYTHGNGIVTAPANEINAALEDSGGQGGLPVFTQDSPDIPPSLRVTEPRTYYGELINTYSIVGAPTGATPVEYDTDTERYTYNGRGGVPLDNIVNRLVFALFYGERNILFNSSINENSKIMYVRDPADRVQAVAPWLTLDGDPYPAVVDGRIQWIVDGYTTLANYPYAERTPLGESTTDALQPGQGGVRPELDRDVSYLRNSVKATVDAYDGTVTLYAFDEKDPVLQTWMKTFPGTVKPASDISPSLRSHFRYPEDQFKVQRELLTRYHVDTPGDFFNNVSFWNVPSDPSPQGAGSGNALPQPPYYILAGTPAEPGSGPSFQLTSALVFQQRQFLSAYLSVSSDPDTYGQMTLLRLPDSTTTQGPQLVQSALVSDPDVSQQIGLLSRNGQSTVDYGNLLTLPVAGGLLFVEPVYIERANQEVSYPQLARVLVFYNGRVGFDATLAGALDEVLPGASAVVPSVPGQAQAQAPAQAGTPAPAAPPGTSNPQVTAAASAIQQAIADLKAANQRGDFEAQGRALAALDAAVQQFQQANGQTPTPAPAPAPGG
jgi:uncharacterized protein